MNYKLLLLLGLLSCSTMVFAADEAGILPQPLVLSVKAGEVYEYRCPRNMQCQVRCSAGTGQESFEYQNVRRFELAKGEAYWAMGAVYIDPVGKGHGSQGIIPKPASCLVDDLVFVSALAVVDGVIQRRDEDQEVIFDVSPTN